MLDFKITIKYSFKLFNFKDGNYLKHIKIINLNKAIIKYFKYKVQHYIYLVKAI